MGKALPDKLLPEQAVKKMEIFNNNTTCNTLIKDQMSQNRTKNIDVTDALSCTKSSRKRRTRN